MRSSTRRHPSPSKHDDEDEFATDAGASLTFPRRAGELHNGDYVMLQNHPCKITNVAKCKTGKHGHAKVTITGIDVLTGKKHTDMTAARHTIPCPNVQRKTCTVSLIDGGVITMVDDKTYRCIEMDLPRSNDFKPLVEAVAAVEDGREEVFVTVVSAMDCEVIQPKFGTRKAA